MYTKNIERWFPGFYEIDALFHNIWSVYQNIFDIFLLLFTKHLFVKNYVVS